MGSILVTPAKLIGELIITHLKLWHVLQDAYDPHASDAEVGKAKRKICLLNAKRATLEDEIDKNFKEWFEGKDLYEFFPALKDYSKSDGKTSKEKD